MPTSIVGSQFVANIAQNQSASAGVYQYHALLAVSDSGVELPTSMAGWLYMHFVRGPQAGVYGIAFMKRIPITTDGCHLVVPSIPGVLVPGDQFVGFQLNAYWFTAGIEWTVAVI